MKMRSKILVALAALILVIIGFTVWHKPAHKPVPSHKAVTNQKVATFDKKQHSLTDPTSIWVIVDKHRPLSPKNYAPNDLVVPSIAQRIPGDASMQVRKVTAQALEQMFAAAKQNGTPLRLSSGYRSYTFQVSLYGGYVKTQGQATADSQSARPGYSEHQTGLASDVEPLDESCHLDKCFANTPAGKWVAANAYKYGFIIRYPEGLTNVTGYDYEPWHVRYIGVPLATELHQQHVQTLEQFFNTGAAPDYL